MPLLEYFDHCSILVRFFKMSVCACLCVYSMHVWTLNQMVLETNSGHQFWEQVSLPAESSRQSILVRYLTRHIDLPILLFKVILGPLKFHYQFWISNTVIRILIGLQGPDVHHLGYQCSLNTKSSFT